MSGGFGALSAGIEASAQTVAAGMGGVFNKRSTDRANKFNRQEAQRQRNFAEGMWQREVDLSNSAVQRHVSDVRQAGLNPMMMYGGAASGAATPHSAGGGAASAASPERYDFSEVGRAVGRGASTALEMARLKKDLQIADKQKNLLTQQALKAGAEARMAFDNIPANSAEAALRQETARIDREMAGIDAGLNRVKKLNPLGGLIDRINQGPRAGRRR